MAGEIFIVTNRKLIKEGSLSELLEKAANAGLDAVILREKDLSTQELTTLALDIKKVLNEKVALIINGDYEAAINVQAEGMHFSYDAFMKFNLDYEGIKGVSIHSKDEAVSAERKGATYVLAGHIFNTSCKPGIEGRGVEFLNDICNSLTIPVIAIGGINEDNIQQVMRCGACGIAIMSTAMESNNVEEYIKKLKEKV